MIAWPDALSVLGAVALAAAGGELFLSGVLRLAAWLRVPKLLVATSLAAFATSSPELTVSTVAALAGQPEIGLGDALGSNVVNIALVFGLALLFGPIQVEKNALDVNFKLALAAPALTAWLALDGSIARIEGVLLLAVFAAWMVHVVRSAHLHRATVPMEETGAGNHWQAVGLGLLGLFALILAGKLFVAGATGIAQAFGVDNFVIGATVVAIGTSLPELVTVLLARWRGHDEISIGTLLGSNLFNGLAIVGVAASIHPIHTSLPELAATLGFGVLSLILLIPGQSGVVGTRRSGLLLLAYAGFVVLTTVSAP